VTVAQRKVYFTTLQKFTTLIRKDLLRPKTNVVSFCNNFFTKQIASDLFSNSLLTSTFYIQDERGLGIDLKAKQPKLDSYFKKMDSLEATISRMTARDGLTFRVFATSEDLRNLLTSKGDENSNLHLSLHFLKLHGM